MLIEYDKTRGMSTLARDIIQSKVFFVSLVKRKDELVGSKSFLLGGPFSERAFFYRKPNRKSLKLPHSRMVTENEPGILVTFGDKCSLQHYTNDFCMRVCDLSKCKCCQ